MMRRLAATLVLVIAAVAVDFYCIRPLRCAIMEHRLEQVTVLLAEHEGGASVAHHARENLNAARGCMSVRPAVINVYMIAAANAQLLDDNRTAADYYRQALHYDRRPEIFINLANVESRLGERQASIENFVLAYKFWPQSGEEIEDPFVHDEVMRQITNYESTLQGHR